MLRFFLIEGILVAACVGLSIPVFASDASSIKQMPIAFTKNMGQWDEQVLYRANAGGATMWFTNAGITYQFVRRIEKSGADPMASLDAQLPGKHMEPDSVEQLVITAKFVGANPDVQVVGEDMMEYKCNYFLGNEPSKWHTDVPNFEAITLKGIYTGVDLRFTSDGNGQVVFEYVVASGSDDSQMKVEYEGGIRRVKDVDCPTTIETVWGNHLETIVASGDPFGLVSPRIGATNNPGGFQSTIACSRLVSPYTLELDYSTYLGGSSADEAYGIAVDISGAAFVAGYTGSSDFPTLSPLDGTANGDYDAFVTKLSPSGASLEYSTYIGGSSADFAHTIAVDAFGAAYLAGHTVSSDLPTPNAFDSSYSGEADSFVMKLSPSGASLAYGTYLGGSSADVCQGIAVDGSGAVYIAGWTSSTDFPTQNAYDGSWNGGVDAYLTKLTPIGNGLLFSTYLGGSSDDYARALAVDSSSAAYIAGETASTDFPTHNAYDGSSNGLVDAFATKMSPSGNSLEYSTYLGGSSNNDRALAVAVDESGTIYLAGYTISTDFPTYNAYDESSNGSADVFVTKLSANGNQLEYSTYLGGVSADYCNAIAIDVSGAACITGLTLSTDFPIENAYDLSYNSHHDVFVTKLSLTGFYLDYSTYLGGSSIDRAQGIAVDVSGAVYIAGLTLSSDFPTQNAYNGSANNDYDVFVTKFRAFGVCGDADGSGQITISDAVYLISYIFAGGPAPSPILSGDADCNAIVTISDAVYLINYIFAGGAAPCAACP